MFHLLKATKHPADYLTGCQVGTSQGENMFKRGLIAFNSRDRQLRLPPQVQKDLDYLRNSGLVWREIPSTTPVEESTPFSQQRCTVDLRRSKAITSATVFVKPALWMSHLITFRHQVKVPLGPCETFWCDSTSWRAQDVLLPEEPTDL